MNKIIAKPWGHEIVIVKTKKYILKKIWIDKNSQLSKTYYRTKDRTVYVNKGVLLLDFSQNNSETNVVKLKEGEHWRIIPKTVCKFCTSDDSPVEILEVSTPENANVVYLDEIMENN